MLQVWVEYKATFPDTFLTSCCLQSISGRSGSIISTHGPWEQSMRHLGRYFCVWLSPMGIGIQFVESEVSVTPNHGARLVFALTPWRDLSQRLLPWHTCSRSLFFVIGASGLSFFSCYEYVGAVRELSHLKKSKFWLDLISWFLVLVEMSSSGLEQRKHITGS